MPIGKWNATGWIVSAALAGAMLLGLAACTCTPCGGAAPAPGPVQVIGQPAAGQQVFATDQAAADALLTAIKARDHAELSHLFGPGEKELVSGDPVADANGFESFVKHATEQMRLEKKGDALSIVHIGAKDWPFPIPLVKTSAGSWFFDTAAGTQEILARRIGRNELHTIAVCREYVAAQREYASQDRDGNEVLSYAQRLNSHPGQNDGLYWEPAAGAEQSPFGPLVAQATQEGYVGGPMPRREPFHGYYFHILKKQGPAAPGGKYDYVINGNMIAGFALIAWPVEYGNSGVMTLIVSHQGKVYQKDLGPKTAELAAKMTEYNPDSTWSLVKD